MPSDAVAALNALLASENRAMQALFALKVASEPGDEPKVMAELLVAALVGVPLRLIRDERGRVVRFEPAP